MADATVFAFLCWLSKRPLGQLWARELEAAHVPYAIQVYSGETHGFTELGSDRYQKDADEKSWAAFADFLATVLKS